MANLTPSHAAAIARLRSYMPPATQWYSLPLSRRAAVLVLLYADKKGELRVVLTMRAKTLSSYAGQAALPGGKSDSLSETPSQTARREAFEEIGLPLSDSNFPPPFRIHPLCQLPSSLARTRLGVRPCVAWIEPDLSLLAPASPSGAGGRITRSQAAKVPSVEEVLIPRLDAKEVAAVFTAPFESFLATSLPASSRPKSRGARSPQPWYDGQWIRWDGDSWRMHNFYMPVASHPVAWAEDPPATSKMDSFRIFGMTARILIDAARIAFGRAPEFEHNTEYGDEDRIAQLLAAGELGERKRSGEGGVVVADGGDQDNEDKKVSKI